MNQWRAILNSFPDLVRWICEING